MHVSWQDLPTFEGAVKPPPLPARLGSSVGKEALDLYAQYAEQHDESSCVAGIGNYAGSDPRAKTAHLNSMSWSECVATYFPKTQLSRKDTILLADWAAKTVKYNETRSAWLASLPEGVRKAVVRRDRGGGSVVEGSSKAVVANSRFSHRSAAPSAAPSRASRSSFTSSWR